jgi:transcriptional regulator with XRE-family HTH domain
VTQHHDDRPLLALARNVRELRQAKGLSIDALAKAAGVSRNTVINIEHGDTSSNLDTVCRLAAALGTRAAVLIDDAPRTGS